MRINKLALPAAFLLALAVPALAEPGAYPPPPPAGDHGPPDGPNPMHHGMADRFMHQFDLNHDGQVTRAEFDRGSAKRFKDIDLNGDGVITADELAQFHPDGPPPPPPGHDGPPPPPPGHDAPPPPPPPAH